jgi:hypothetical protein
MENNKIYIIVSKKCSIYGHGFVNPLGHEIHLTRFILFDLLQKNVINLECMIVTLYEDRFFLYNKTFKNIITWDEYVNNKKTDKNIEIDLTYYSCVSTQNDQIKEFDVLNYHLNTFERTQQFVNYINDLNFNDLTKHPVYSDIINEKFIVIHWRTNIIGLSKDKIESLLRIINKLKENFDLKIVIFSVENININLENVYVINNLQLYASFLNNKNCDLFISEWSGGGQLSQYCCNSKIIYFFDDYPSHDYEIHYKYYQQCADLNNNIFACWDFKTTTNCERFYYKTLDIMLENI